MVSIQNIKEVKDDLLIKFIGEYKNASGMLMTTRDISFITSLRKGISVVEPSDVNLLALFLCHWMSSEIVAKGILINCNKSNLLQQSLSNMKKDKLLREYTKNLNIAKHSFDADNCASFSVVEYNSTTAPKKIGTFNLIVVDATNATSEEELIEISDFYKLRESPIHDPAVIVLYGKGVSRPVLYKAFSI